MNQTFPKLMFIKLDAIALPVFLVINMIRIGVVARNFYRSQIGGLMKSDINWTAAVLFYLLVVVGLVLSAAVSPRRTLHTACLPNDFRSA